MTSEEFYNVASEILKRIYSIENTQRFFISSRKKLWQNSEILEVLAV